MLGYTQEESLRNTLEQVLTPASAAVARQRLNDIIATAASGQRVEPGCAELELVCKDGSTRWGEVSYQARQDASGTLINIVCTNRDINARHRADDALRQLEQEKSVILQTACDGFVLMSQDGRLLEVNDAYCRMTGYTREELLTLCIPDLEVVEQPETIEHHREQVLRHGSDRFETHHRCKDGRLIDVEVTVDHLRSH